MSRPPTWTVTVDNGDGTEQHTVTGAPQYKEGPFLAFILRDDGIGRVSALFSAHTIVSVIVEAQ